MWDFLPWIEDKLLKILMYSSIFSQICLDRFYEVCFYFCSLYFCTSFIKNNVASRPGKWLSPVLVTGEATPQVLHPFRDPQYRKDIEGLEHFWRRAIELGKGLEGKSFITAWAKILARGRSASSPRQPATGQEDLQSRTYRRGSGWTSEKVVTHWNVYIPGTWWSHHSWRRSRNGWMWCLEPWFSWQGVD